MYRIKEKKKKVLESWTKLACNCIAVVLVTCDVYRVSGCLFQQSVSFVIFFSLSTVQRLSCGMTSVGGVVYGKGVIVFFYHGSQAQNANNNRNDDVWRCQVKNITCSKSDLTSCITEHPPFMYRICLTLIFCCTC